MSAAQALLAEEFNIMFREFHEFVLISNKIGRYIEFETICQFYQSGETKDFINTTMPELINETMQKIIKNAPYEDGRKQIAKTTSIEEEKKDGEVLDHGASIQRKAVSVQDIRVEFPAEKPWKTKKNKKAAAKAPPKKAKVYDATKYTQQQMEVLELLDENVELNDEQRRIH